MDNFEIINKTFRTILPILVQYIGTTLKEKDEKNWWKKYVLSTLTESTIRSLPKNGTFDDYINSLDIQACLNIIIKNWNDVFSYKFKNKFLTYAHEIKNIRNEIDAHYTMETLKTLNGNDVKRAIDTIAIFMEPIDKAISRKIQNVTNNIQETDGTIKSNNTIIEIKENNVKKTISGIKNIENEKWDTVHIFSKDDKHEYRYVLGSRGNNPIIFFGINPSTATGFNPQESDPTANIVKNISERLKLNYDSCYLINIYPQRAKEPKYLDIKPNHLAHDENIKYIKYIIKNNSNILAGWGNLMDKKKRKYLIKYLIDIYNELKGKNINWYSIENKLQGIHPPHPARKTIKKIEEFNMEEYIQKIK
jgi:hypothetical protein